MSVDSYTSYNLYNRVLILLYIQSRVSQIPIAAGLTLLKSYGCKIRVGNLSVTIIELYLSNINIYLHYFSIKNY